MERNLDRRVELFFPVEDAKAYDQIMQVLNFQLSDTERSRLMDESGSYHTIDRRGKQQSDCQLQLCEQTIQRRREESKTQAELRFSPVFANAPDRPLTDDGLS